MRGGSFQIEVVMIKRRERNFQREYIYLVTSHTIKCINWYLVFSIIVYQTLVVEVFSWILSSNCSTLLKRLVRRCYSKTKIFHWKRFPIPTFASDDLFDYPFLYIPGFRVRVFWTDSDTIVCNVKWGRGGLRSNIFLILLPENV